MLEELFPGPNYIKTLLDISLFCVQSLCTVV